MKIDVRVIDLRDDKEHTAIVESWETVRTIKNLIEDSTGVPAAEQHYYLGDELIEDSMPADQLRLAAKAAGRLPPDDRDKRKVVEVTMFAGKGPVDFDDMVYQDVIKKLRTHEIIMKRINIRLHKDNDDEKYIFNVDASLLTVDNLKRDLIKCLGPSSFTGLTTDNILLYARQVQPGKPLEGLEIQECIGPRPALDVEVYPMHPEMTLLCKVKKWGLSTKEQFEVKVQDHLLLKDLKKLLVNRLQKSENPQVQQRNYTVENLKFKLNGKSINPARESRLRRRYGIPTDDLWLRAFNIKEGSHIVIPL
ncbi:hypothetical protein BESB_049830 [Besnoitia besnoiti]|uniref:Ubiquitin-like domain-containing protein n=1 Tax=Besnoitia besnoiti TaxID=94643 RepID=A0A2A9MKI3_BESBE|nr:hypothetical protein BESB_049830 [Besnoitia besnoiti]PFH36791.1 hypothetical protein BESB_049830 [Besnoitia besnoiti]